MRNIAVANPFTGIQVPGVAVPQVDPNNTSVGMAITKLLPYIFSASALILLVYLVVAGLQLMLSRGDPKGVQAAQSKITTSLVGFGIVFLAFAIVKLIGQIFDVSAFRVIFQ